MAFSSASSLGPTDHAVLHRLAPEMIGSLSRRAFGQWLSQRMLEEGIVAQPASQRWNVLKLTPPLTVSDDEIDRVVSAVAAIFEEHRDLTALLRDVVRRVGPRPLGG